MNGQNCKNKETRMKNKCAYEKDIRINNGLPNTHDKVR